MQKMITFKVNGGIEDISFIPIEEIELDRMMENTLKEEDEQINLDKFKLKTRANIVGEKLQRMEE